MHIDEEFQIVEERQHCITALAVQSFVHDAEEGGIGVSNILFRVEIDSGNLLQVEPVRIPSAMYADFASRPMKVVLQRATWVHDNSLCWLVKSFEAVPPAVGARIRELVRQVSHAE